MILLYSKHKTSRIDYITGLIFKELMGYNVRVTTQKETYSNHEGIKLWYDDAPAPGGLKITPAGLVHAKGTKEVVTPQLTEYRGIPCLFPVTGGALPYDPFSAAFFLVTRYEEYHPYQADEHGRFQASSSFSFKHNFLHKPVVNHYALHLKEQIQAQYPDFQPQQATYQFTLTVDVDSAWAIRNKGPVRTLGAILKDLKKGDLKKLTYRFRVLRGKEPDPFDSFNHLFTYRRRFEMNLIFFILLGDYGKYDKNINWYNVRFQELIKQLADIAPIGIHPSYESRNRPAQVAEEIARLEQITRKEVTKSRQHFLRLNMPTTYRTLVAKGILEDYTMGYADDYGFRAGICTPYYFYDLDLEQITGLRVFPFAFMDGTLRDYLGKSVEESKTIIDTLLAEVRAVNGHFIALWHNESLGNKGRWEGWKTLCDYMIQNGRAPHA